MTYRHEDIRPVPHGYKVRTVTRGGHRVRIAFPPGRRVAGSGVLVSILHPMGENPCRLRNPMGVAELVLMGAANPARVRHDSLWRQARGLLKGNRNPDRWEGARRILTGQRNASDLRIVEREGRWLLMSGSTVVSEHASRADAQAVKRDIERKETPRHSRKFRSENPGTETYFKGDRAEYTGKVEKLYGGTFYEVRILEGHLKGQLRVVKTPPKQSNPDAIGQHKGYDMFFAGTSYNAPALKLYGYSTDLALRRAIDRKLKSKNPDALEHAESLYEDFHGRAPSEVIELQEADTVRKTYTALGDLVDLTVERPDGKSLSIGFVGDGVKVASAPGGRQLYLIGGGQSLDDGLDQFQADTSKDFVELGRAIQITYRARKGINDFRLVDYFHDLGEESGNPPLAFYDRLRQRIYFVGGSYHVEAPGIID